MLANFNLFLVIMAAAAAGVFVALHFFEAGYGYLFDRHYEPPVPNRIGWCGRRAIVPGWWNWAWIPQYKLLPLCVI